LIKQRTEFYKSTLLISQRMLQVAAEGLNALRPVRTVKDGDKEILEPAIEPIELVRLAEAAWKLQQNVGRADEERVAQIVVHIGNAEDMEAMQSNGRDHATSLPHC
jgi:hypothetical protein